MKFIDYIKSRKLTAEARQYAVAFRESNVTCDAYKLSLCPRPPTRAIAFRQRKYHTVTLNYLSLSLFLSYSYVGSGHAVTNLAFSLCIRYVPQSPCQLSRRVHHRFPQRLLAKDGAQPPYMSVQNLLSVAQKTSRQHPPPPPAPATR
jgi:hypothetical protein